ncbi:MAG: choice-of-anchor D domain-containing protein [Myxococcales bacterium]|nr:choice-of-anchor D domain-containing protein [Myxococcales bacterium]
MDFGVARVGCPGVARQVTLRNDGTTAVQISSVDLSQATPGTFTLSGPATPLNLAPASQRVFDVTYAPVAAGAEAGALEATYGAQSDLLSATLIAEGTVATSQTDNFTQAGGPLDVLLVVDDSPEMMPFQSQLSSDLLFLFLTLDYEGWDYQIGVTSTDVTPTGARGALVGNPPLITPQTPNAETLLEARVLLGENGSGTEEGLEASRLAVTGANAGWPRANAAFLVIYLSDEDDQSPMMVSQYSTIFDNLKGAGNQDLVAASAIVSTATFCTIPDGTLADYGGRYIGMAALTRGTVSHICDSSFQDVLQATPPIPRNQAFTLSARPEPSSVQVYVNNVLIDGLAGANWSYQAASNQVVFSVAQAPALGRPVRITYNIACN